ncbi:MAG TPA: hypothetical protein VFT74_03680 [Isosphaeraceae bacterium]|nr:hypothetical protein [Isosphaeraceae bacterium]
MSEVLTIETIRKQFPAEWVLIGDPQTDELSRLLAGRVIFHSHDRGQVHQKAVELRLPHFAVRFLGTMPENMALVL